MNKYAQYVIAYTIIGSGTFDLAAKNADRCSYDLCNYILSESGQRQLPKPIPNYVTAVSTATDAGVYDFVKKL